MIRLQLVFLLLFSAANAADIRTFGACQGRADDTAAVQAAINAALASSTDNTVSFSCVAPIRSVIISPTDTQRPVLLTTSTPGNGVKQVGTPTNKTIGSSIGAAILLNTCHRCVVRGLTINGNGNGGGIAVQRSTAPQIVENTLYGHGGGMGAITGLGNNDALYARNRIYNTAGAARGMWIGNSGTGTVADYEIGPTIVDNDLHDLAATGIVLMAYQAVVRGNSVRNTQGAGIAIASTPYSKSVGILVANNTFASNRFHGIQSDATKGSRSRNVTLTDNVVELNDGSGIYAVNASGWTISGNICRDNNRDGIQTGAGIVIDLADNVTATGNQCISANSGQSAGIIVGHGGTGSPGVSNVMLSGNVLQGHGTNELVDALVGPVRNYSADVIYQY